MKILVIRMITRIIWSNSFRINSLSRLCNISKILICSIIRSKIKNYSKKSFNQYSLIYYIIFIHIFILILSLYYSGNSKVKKETNQLLIGYNLYLQCLFHLNLNLDNNQVLQLITIII